jgi:hypothetical protein
VTTSKIPNQSQKIIQIELQYLPCLEYFTCLLNYDTAWIDIEEVYQKQTYRNRCDVLTANKTDMLTVPVKSYDKNCSTKDIEIDYGQDWTRRHLGCLRSGYGKSPYFEFYIHAFEEVYYKRPALLFDLNYELLTICLRLVGVKTEVKYNLSVPFENEIDVESAMSLINNKKTPKWHKYYKSVPYYQTFGNDFVSNLSIVDLIFNMGPESRSVLTRSLNNNEAN